MVVVVGFIWRTGGGKNMSKGMRQPKKPTIKQLNEIVSLISSKLDQTAHMVNILFQEVDKQNTVMLKLLQDLGKLEVKVCPHCEATQNLPLLPDIEPDPRCYACGKMMDDEPLGEEE